MKVELKPFASGRKGISFAKEGFCGYLVRMAGIELSVEWLNRLVAAVQYTDAYASDVPSKLYQGLFRVPASSDLLDKLKERVQGFDDVGTCLEGLEEFRQEHPDKEESINAIASLLKWILRSFPVALVPFDFAMTDLSNFGYDRIADDTERGRVGCQLAQDLILAMSMQLEAYDVNVVVETVSAVAQLLSMLCTVSRVSEIGMDDYNLSVPILPSLCNSRNPIDLVKEHTEQQVFGTRRRAAETDGTALPISQLQVLILYGHRIWGYVEHIMPSLGHALNAIAEVSHSASSDHRVRKRDVLKRFLVKMKLKSKSSKSAESPRADRSESHDNFFKRLFSKKNGEGNVTTGNTPAVNTAAGLGRFARLGQSSAVGEEDLKRLGIGRAKSVKLMSPILSNLQGGTEQREDSAEETSHQSSQEEHPVVHVYHSVDDDDCTDSEEQEDEVEPHAKQTLGLHGVELLREFVVPDSGSDRLSRRKTTRVDTSTIHKVSSADPIRRVASSRF